MPISTFNEESLIQHYNKQIAKHGPSIDALQWYSHFTQHTRYEILCHNLPEQIKSICDVGCGCGDLYHYIKLHNLPLSYTGIDISAKMIVAAQKAYPKGIFKCLPINTLSINNRFDCTMASGVFNLKMEDHLNYVLSMIKNMIRISKYQVRFNLLSHKAKKWSKSDTFVYIDPAILQNKLKQDVKKISILDTYLPNDATLILDLV